MEEYEQQNLFEEEFPKYQINKPIRLIELFGGIGSQSMALQRMGVDFERYRLVEFDDFAIKSYNAIHGTNFPALDITNIHAADLGIKDTDKYEYLMFYSFPCFTADTLVLTNSGYKKIIDVKAGDYVLTHTNKWQKVINFFDNGKREILKLHLSNIPNIKCTLNHKFYACNFRRKTKTTWKGNKSVYLYNAIIQENEGWKEAKDLKKNDFVLYPVIEDEIKFHTNNEDFWYIVGRYVADGCVRKGNFNRKITISCNQKKLEQLVERISHLNIEYKTRKGTTCFELDIYNKEFNEFIKNNCGCGSKNKFISTNILKLPKKELQAFLDGYISGDGSISPTGRIVFASVNLNIINSICMIIAKLYRIVPSVSFVEEDREKIVCGNKCKASDYYNAFYQINSKYHKSFVDYDGKLWVRVKDVCLLNIKENVYDIEVENDHSFVVGCAAHNCQDLSLAGKQKGMEEGSGTRSSLLFEVKRLLSECGDNLPQILISENVPQLHSEKNLPAFDRWIQFLQSLGYSNFCEDLNAKDFGIPQNRDRCFMVSILGSFDFVFPRKIPLEKVMADVLEEDVPEKFFISNEKADKLIEQLIKDGKLDDE